MSACALQVPMRKCGFHFGRLLQLAFLESARRFGVYLLVVLAVASNGCTAGVGKSMAPLSLVPPGQGISFPREYFGMHIHNAEKPGHWPAIPFGSWRLWDAYVGWADLQPARGKWDFRKLDSFVDKAQSAGVSTLLPLGRTPNWASARPTEHSPYGPGQAAEPANIEDWRNYVRTVVSRYRGRIPAYQILNEANLTMFWTGSIPKLVELTRVAHEEIKRIDPSAVLVSPSATGLDARIAWVRSFLDAGGASAVDVVSYHLYDNNNPPEAMIPKVLELRAQLKAGGYAAKPLWNTETGLVINNIKPAPGVAWNEDWLKQRLEPGSAANYVMRAFLISRALGFERYYWFAWDNRWFGLIEPADLSLKAPAKAYAHAMVYLMRSTLERCDRDADGLWVCRLRMANGLPAQAFWMDPAAPSQRKEVPRPFSGKVIRFDGKNSVEAPAGVTLSVGPYVTLVVQAP